VSHRATCVTDMPFATDWEPFHVQHSELPVRHPLGHYQAPARQRSNAEPIHDCLNKRVRIIYLQGDLQFHPVRGSQACDCFHRRGVLVGTDQLLADRLAERHRNVLGEAVAGGTDENEA
jgi:hypothetical protein